MSKSRSPNQLRALRAKQMIAREYRNGDIRDDFVDALVNLRHLCDVETLDFGVLDGIAYEHYITEIYQYGRSKECV